MSSVRPEYQNARSVARHRVPRVDRLVLILCFCYPEAANFVLQSRTFESEPFCRPPLPAIRPAAAFNASTITLDSACLKLEGELTATTRSEEAGSVAVGSSNSSPRVTMTALSMKFGNSRTLPFHGQSVSISIACLEIDIICLRMGRHSFETK
jgi:hypothetical protein